MAKINSEESRTPSTPPFKGTAVSSAKIFAVPSKRSVLGRVGFFSKNVNYSSRNEVLNLIFSEK